MGALAEYIHTAVNEIIMLADKLLADQEGVSWVGR